jgi:hypothetical protein
MDNKTTYLILIASFFNLIGCTFVAILMIKSDHLLSSLAWSLGIAIWCIAIFLQATATIILMGRLDTKIEQIKNS